VIIHPAAFTDVDACESQQDKAFLINGIGTRNIAIAAREVDAKLFYISTDYVFDGTKPEPYREYDNPNPQTIYGKSKLLGEEFVKGQLTEFFILRIAWLYGHNGQNFLKTMLRLVQEKREIRVVNDQCGTPTWTVDIAHQIEKLLATDAYGIYHCTSQGSCTWYEFALEIFKSAGYEVQPAPTGSVHLIPRNQQPRTNPQYLTPNNQDLKPITLTPVSSEQFPRPAKRPANSVLDNYMLKLQGLEIMPDWKEALKKFMETS
jgi:dTDP-4-dehydrorhamnose reductase